MADKFVQRDNITTLNLLRNWASSDYQRRIPDATKGNLQDTLHSLFSYRPVWNEFVDSLVNRIGREYVVFQSYQNKLAIFKDEAMLFGDTIEETGVGLTEARRYDPSRNYLEGEIFGQRRPDTRTAFHRVNRQDHYDISVNEPMLRRAFVNPSGLSNFVSALMESPITSDQWDEYLLMAGLLGQMHKLGAFWKVNVPDVSNVSSDAPAARFLLRQARAWAEKLGFISPHYNLARLDTFVKPEDIVFFVTPDSKAAIDVEALAAAFNVTYAELEQRTITVRPEDVNIPGFQAALVSRNFFKVADTYLETTSANNPLGLHQNYFLHHHEIVSASPMAPAILFTSTEASDVLLVNETPVESVTLEIQDNDGVTVTSVERGKFYRAVGSAVTDPTGGYNDAVRLAIEPGYSSVHTYIRPEGQFSVALDEDAASLTVTAYATDTAIPQTMAQVTVTVVGAKAEFPPPGVAEDEDNDGLFEVTPEEPTFDDPDVTIPAQVGVVYMEGVTELEPGVITITEATTIDAVPAEGFEFTGGAVDQWIFTPV